MRKQLIKLVTLNLVLNLVLLLAAGLILPLILPLLRYGRFPSAWVPNVNILVSIFVSAEAFPISFLNFIVFLVYNFHSLKSDIPSPLLTFFLGLFIAYLSTFLTFLMVGLFVSMTSNGIWVSPFLMIPWAAFPFPQGFILVGP